MVVPLVDTDNEQWLDVEEIRPAPDLLNYGYLPIAVGFNPKGGQQRGRGQRVGDHLCSLSSTE
jgi:hypothetical protein